MKHSIETVKLGNFLCKDIARLLALKIDKEWYNPFLKFYSDFNDRNDDESEGRRVGGIESQYGDYFVILPTTIIKTNLPYLEVLLNNPYNGNLYVSNYDNRMQVRISGYTVKKLYEKNLKERVKVNE